MEYKSGDEGQTVWQFDAAVSSPRYMNEAAEVTIYRNGIGPLTIGEAEQLDWEAYGDNTMNNVNRNECR